MKKFLLLSAILLVVLSYFVSAQCETLDTQTEDVLIDSDCDIYPDIDDNCPNTANPDQEDSDGNGIGDACESRVQTSHPPVPVLINEPVDEPVPVLISMPITSNTLDIQYITINDLQKGGLGELYTIKVTNTLGYSVPVSIKVSDIYEWGTYSIKPSSLLTLGSGKSAKFHIYVKADFTAPSGEQKFHATVVADGKERELELYANIIGEGKGTSKSRDYGTTLETVLIFIVVLLLVIGLAGGYDRLKKR
ncbi:MAG: thrombospondin type 3 repeat-containing protein [Nanoarchaeota archaeon]|nr:thrombospondin type 3 repeat-containing protein [Nanoarchaeota archaeon]